MTGGRARTDADAMPLTVTRKGAARLFVVGAVVMLFVGLLLGKTLMPATEATTTTSLTSIRNDASGDYRAALSTGKPIYVLFHSLS